MTLSIWSNGQLVAEVVGQLSRCPTPYSERQCECLVDRFFDADDFFEIFDPVTPDIRTFAQGIRCWPDSDRIVFTFVRTNRQ